MSERYSRLFTLPENLYLEGSPLLIAAGALLKDNVNNTVLAQLKLKSLSNKLIKAVTVGVIPLDVAGRKLSNAVIYQYLDISIKRGDEFGQKRAIRLSNSSTRSFKIFINEVVFEDNSIYSSPECEWTPVDITQITVESKLKDAELIQQFHMTYGTDYRYIPKDTRDLWICSCSAINRNNEKECYKCGQEHASFDILDINALKAAHDERLENERKDAERKEEQQKNAVKCRRKLILIVTSILLCCTALAFLLLKFIIPNIKYNSAVALVNEGNYQEAITAFKGIPEYRDSAEQIVKCKYLILASSKVGDHVFWGAYEQDNVTSNGKEEIEWLVLDKQDDKLLLISRYGLDAKPYNVQKPKYTQITWETCTLRSWLNETFIYDAFDQEERQYILLTDLDNSQSQCYNGWDSSGGSNTQDKVFLLSYAEANMYFGIAYSDSDNITFRISPTDYAKAAKALASIKYKTANDKYAGRWWLRSPGSYRSSAACINTDGSLYSRSVDDGNSCVRPALWIAIESETEHDETKASGQIISETPDATEVITPVQDTPRPTETITAEQSTFTTIVPSIVESSTISQNTKVGDYVYFGSYEQDNNISNGKESIEWLVLDKQDSKILLLSRYALDCKQYNAEKEPTAWDSCTLRSWLNDDFFNSAFSEDEKISIMQTVVSADKNTHFDTDFGSDTTDYLFLLSSDEVKEYLPDNSTRRCVPTEYAISQGAFASSDYKVDEKNTCWWWLRSPGGNQYNAENIRSDGNIYYNGFIVNYDLACVRPAVWVDLGSEF